MNSICKKSLLPDKKADTVSNQIQRRQDSDKLFYRGLFGRKINLNF